MARTKTSKAWMREHVNDHFVQRAKAEGWRSRAMFKLKEIDERDQLIRPGMLVVDLGATPGGWSQWARRRVGPKGRVVALDLLPLEPIAGVEFLQGDFREEVVLAAFEKLVGGAPVDLVLSDMAPNISGIAVTDQARALHLGELALEFARAHLKPGGDLLIKVFQGSGLDALRDDLKRSFAAVAVRKPQSSRDRSAELFLLARGFRG
jgi:23S rRNA (uridine2552-2'-O)-methyltransferase